MIRHEVRAQGTKCSRQSLRLDRVAVRICLIAEDYGFIEVWHQERMKCIASLLLIKRKDMGKKSPSVFPTRNHRALFSSWRTFIGTTMELWCILYTANICKFLVKFDSRWWALKRGRRRSWSCWWCQYWWHLFDGSAWQSSDHETP